MGILYLSKEVWGVEFHYVLERVIGKRSQPKTSPKNIGIYYFSPEMRAYVGCSEERCRFPCVAPGKPVDILLKNVF
jgi:hypothetical protein